MDRAPLGIPMEDIRRFAYALMELDSFLQCSGADRAMSLCDNLRSELDAHIFDEFADLPKQERFNITYSADALGFKLKPNSLDHALELYPEILQRLERAVPDSRIHQLAQALGVELEKSDVRKKLQDNLERHERSGNFS